MAALDIIPSIAVELAGFYRGRGQCVARGKVPLLHGVAGHGIVQEIWHSITQTIHVLILVYLVLKVMTSHLKTGMICPEIRRCIKLLLQDSVTLL